VVDVVEGLEPYLTLLTAILSLSMLGLIFRLVALSQSAKQDQIELAKARLEAKEEELQTTRNLHQLQIDRLHRDLEGALGRANASILEIASSSAPIDIDIQREVESTLGKIQELERGAAVPAEPSADQHRERGRAAAYVGDWPGAADEYAAYVAIVPDDWEAQYLLAVSLANQRSGDASNIAALRSISDAISYFPVNGDDNMRARMYGYRGAMLKRLGRYQEALASLCLAEELATSQYEIDDIAYNFASVYALAGDRDAMLDWLKKVPPAHRRHLDGSEYFRAYRADPDFIALTRNDLHFDAETK
jgi:tetratricopeptide (TPR) repeat protein